MTTGYVSRAKCPQIGLFPARPASPKGVAVRLMRDRSSRILAVLRAGLRARRILVVGSGKEGIWEHEKTAGSGQDPAVF